MPASLWHPAREDTALSEKHQLDPFAISRPHPSLLKYYICCAILTGPLFPFVFLPLFFKYETLRYRFDAEGVFMSWGILWRREVNLTYRRIQDIHLTRNIIQRWLGLATVSIQTAAGSATPEMQIEGILEAEELRDYLYSRMRGSLAEAQGSAPGAAQDAPSSPAGEALTLLREIRDDLRRLSARREAAS